MAYRAAKDCRLARTKGVLNMKLKIGGRLMAAGAAIVIIPFAIMGVIVSTQAASGITALTKGQIADLTSSLADNANNAFDDLKHAAMALAFSSDVEATIAESDRGAAHRLASAPRFRRGSPNSVRRRNTPRGSTI